MPEMTWQTSHNYQINCIYASSFHELKHPTEKIMLYANTDQVTFQSLQLAIEA
jgi:hypothetical protein